MNTSTKTVVDFYDVQIGTFLDRLSPKSASRPKIHTIHTYEGKINKYALIHAEKQSSRWNISSQVSHIYVMPASVKCSS